jgi:hypothetical protein
MCCSRFRTKKNIVVKDAKIPYGWRSPTLYAHYGETIVLQFLTLLSAMLHRLASGLHYSLFLRPLRVPVVAGRSQYDRSLMLNATATSRPASLRLYQSRGRATAARYHDAQIAMRDAKGSPHTCPGNSRSHRY